MNGTVQSVRPQRATGVRESWLPGGSAGEEDKEIWEWKGRGQGRDGDRKKRKRSGIDGSAEKKQKTQLLVS